MFPFVALPITAMYAFGSGDRVSVSPGAIVLTEVPVASVGITAPAVAKAAVEADDINVMEVDALYIRTSVAPVSFIVLPATVAVVVTGRSFVFPVRLKARILSVSVIT